ncbi:MAG TPA: hypothetical protein VFU98_13405, partial [Microlunatus sp.]|nr:hypothetical protein [Microlunatus sp.]
TPLFAILNSEFRRRVIEEAAAHQLDLIFTFVWQLEDPADAGEVERLVASYADAPDGEIAIVELYADLGTRLARNRGEDRIAAKPTKRDLAWSDANVRDLERYVLNTDPTSSSLTPADAFLTRYPHLRLETSAHTPAETAERVLSWLDEQR